MTPRSRATVTGRIKEPQTLSSLVSRWGHRLLVAHQRNSVFSELRQSLLDRIHSAICSTPSSILRRCNPSDEGWPPVLELPYIQGRPRPPYFSERPSYLKKIYLCGSRGGQSGYEKYIIKPGK